MGGGFSESSRNIQLVHNHILRAECRNEHGDYCTSEIDLDRHIGNLNGYLAWDCVDFSKTTQNIRFIEHERKIEGTLVMINGQQSAPQGIYLDQRIVNRNGRLEFRPSRIFRHANIYE